MRSVSFYDPKTGLFNGTQLLAPDDETVTLNTPSGYLPLDGHFDSLSQMVDIANPSFIETTGADGQPLQTPVYSVIEYQPPAPSADYEWNAATKRWQLSAAAQSKVDGNAVARARIAELEISQHRAVREFALGMPGTLDRLTKIDAEIASLRPQLT